MKKILFIFFSLTCLAFHSSATHIVGGGFNLTWLHDSVYLLQLRIIRDCKSQVPFDNPISTGRFARSNDNRIAIDNLSLDSVRSLTFDTNACYKVNSIFCREIGYYNKIIILSPNIYSSSKGYYISWERCCRNSSICNINQPIYTGTTFNMEIPATSLVKNSSPRWTNNPRKILCVGNLFSYNFNFTDPDGDSLVYSLVTPLQGNLNQTYPINNGNPQSAPYALVSWANGYDIAHPIKGNPPLSIYQFTGEVTVTPDSIGIYASAIRVEEFRSGIKIGETRMELEYIVNMNLGTGIKEIKKKQAIKIYPNPATNEIFIDATSVQNTSEAVVEIFDLNGSNLFSSIEKTKGEIKINLNSLDAGMYFLKVNNLVVKFVKSN